MAYQQDLDDPNGLDVEGLYLSFTSVVFCVPHSA
jgi:hypothetical protein